MKFSIQKSADSNHSIGNQKGFTLIELLVVLAIIAVLIALLLPAVQKVREAAARMKAEAECQLVAVAANQYRNATGNYPTSLQNLVEFAENNPSSGIVIDLALKSGKKNGYVLTLVEHSSTLCEVSADPEFIGITGSVSLSYIAVAGEVRKGYEIESAGAGPARERMLLNIRAEAAKTIKKLLRLDSSATSQMRDHLYNPYVTVDVVEKLDTDDNQKVSLCEILNSPSLIQDRELRSPFEEFIKFVRSEMKLDSLSDEVKCGISVGLNETAQSQQPQILSYSSLSDLTKLWVNKSETATLLCADLKAAENAEGTGDVSRRNRSLTSFQNKVEMQAGLTMTRGAADSLIALAEGMK